MRSALGGEDLEPYLFSVDVESVNLEPYLFSVDVESVNLEPYLFSVDVESVNPTPIVLELMERSMPAGRQLGTSITRSLPIHALYAISGHPSSNWRHSRSTPAKPSRW